MRRAGTDLKMFRHLNGAGRSKDRKQEGMSPRLIKKDNGNCGKRWTVFGPMPAAWLISFGWEPEILAACLWIIWQAGIQPMPWMGQRKTHLLRQRISVIWILCGRGSRLEEWPRLRRAGFGRINGS